MATATQIETMEDLGLIFERLGGIAPSRVLLLKPIRPATENDLIAINGLKKSIFEMVDGFLVEKAMGYTESDLTLVLAGYLRAFVIPRNLGLVSGADGMMRLLAGQVRVPDLAFASWERIPGRRRPIGPIANFAPDLAIEVLSQSNIRAEMVRKRQDYFGAGVRTVWEVDSVARTVLVYDAVETFRTLSSGEILDGGTVLPGFQLPLADLFGELDRQGN